MQSCLYVAIACASLQEWWAIIPSPGYVAMQYLVAQNQLRNTVIPDDQDLLWTSESPSPHWTSYQAVLWLRKLPSTSSESCLWPPVPNWDQDFLSWHQLVLIFAFITVCGHLPYVCDDLLSFYLFLFKTATSMAKLPCTLWGCGCHSESTSGTLVWCVKVAFFICLLNSTFPNRRTG